MIEAVDNFLDKFGLKDKEVTFLVGFSGGADSLCLLHVINVLAKKYHFNLVAMHLNHNWRGDESLKEAENCEIFCKKNGIEILIKTLDSKSKKTETVAREERYKFFTECSKKYSNPVILTAHTKSDNAETLLYRVIKGTGIKGLQGIQECRYETGVKILRPLLSFSRLDIEKYCKNNSLVPNLDSSNADINYKRNFIRHKILPLLSDINPDYENAINSLSEIAKNNQLIVEEYISILNNEAFDGAKLITKKFLNLSLELKNELIYRLVVELELDYDRKKIKDVLAFIEKNTSSKSGNRLSLTTNLWLFVNDEYIYTITKIKSELLNAQISVNKEGEYIFYDKILLLKKYSGNPPVKYPTDEENEAYVDLSEIGTDFVLRTRRDGDFITPFGMLGKMKLKKYLTSKAIPAHKKDELVLLARGSEIFWVIGVGLSNKLKVVNKPTHVIKLVSRKA